MLYASLVLGGQMSPTEDVYARAGFGHSIVRGERPALLVVDFSRGFTEAEFPTGTDLSAEVEATARLAEAARSKSVPVIFTVIAFHETLRDAGVWPAKFPGATALVEGTPGVDLDPRLQSGPDDLVVVKKGASAFFGTNVAGILAAQRVDTVIVCGATTSGCVRASVVDSMQYGFQTMVVRDCVGDRAAGPHEANLFDMQAKYADVVSLDEALEYVAGVPAAAAAKA
jgi:N-formylmaleamate deformylase